jgi:hypothetical protein
VQSSAPQRYLVGLLDELWGHLLLKCTQFQEDNVEDDLAKGAETGMLTLQYASPESEEDMDEENDNEDDDEEVEEVEEDEKDVRPAPPSKAPQMVPRQVGMTESRPCITYECAIQNCGCCRVSFGCWSCTSPEVSS